MINLFGLILTTSGQRKAELEAVRECTIDECNQLLVASNEQLEFWKAKYYYAKARACVAEQFQRKTTIIVKPVAMGVDSGVRIEVGHASETEIREA